MSFQGSCQTPSKGECDPAAPEQKNFQIFVYDHILKHFFVCSLTLCISQLQMAESSNWVPTLWETEDTTPTNKFSLLLLLLLLTTHPPRASLSIRVHKNCVVNNLQAKANLQQQSAKWIKLFKVPPNLMTQWAASSNPEVPIAFSSTKDSNPPPLAYLGSTPDLALPIFPKQWMNSLSREAPRKGTPQELRNPKNPKSWEISKEPRAQKSPKSQALAQKNPSSQKSLVPNCGTITKPTSTHETKKNPSTRKNT